MSTCEPKTPPKDLLTQIRRLDFVGLVVFILLSATATFFVIRGFLWLAGV